jgi:hypothetical protein
MQQQLVEVVRDARDMSDTMTTAVLEWLNIVKEVIRMLHIQSLEVACTKYINMFVRSFPHST